MTLPRTGLSQSKQTSPRISLPLKTWKNARQQQQESLPCQPWSHRCRSAQSAFTLEDHQEHQPAPLTATSPQAVAVAGPCTVSAINLTNSSQELNLGSCFASMTFAQAQFGNHLAGSNTQCQRTSHLYTESPQGKNPDLPPQLGLSTNQDFQFQNPLLINQLTGRAE